MKLKTIVTVILTILPYLGSVAQTGTATFTDTRDNKTYRTVKIGKLTWMAENLNYKTNTTSIDSSWCYNDDNANCEKYGRLYNLNAARTACPAGWRLPDTNDLKDLVAAAGGWSVAGKNLKSQTGWYRNGNGTDKFEFTALPGGYRNSNGDFRYDAGLFGYWWNAEYDDDCTWQWSINYYLKGMGAYCRGKRDAVSARCVRNVRP